MSPTDVLRTSAADVMRTSPYGLIFTPRNVSYRRPEDVLKTSLYGSISKAKKCPRYKDFCIWSQHQEMLYY